MADRRLILDASNASDGHPRQLGHVALRVARAPQNLDLVTLEHVDHPFPRRYLMRRVWPPLTSSGTGQNFRKGCGQNFRNPQSFFLGAAAAVLFLGLMIVTYQLAQWLREPTPGWWSFAWAVAPLT
jgi:hypothetical protein